MENLTNQNPNSEWQYNALWGETTQGGFTAIPNTLLKAQAELELTGNDMMVLLNLIMHWWQSDEFPFPRTTTISKRTGLKLRTVQRSMNRLQKLGYIERERRGDKTYANLTGIKEKLLKLSNKYVWQYRDKKDAT